MPIVIDSAFARPSVTTTILPDGVALSSYGGATLEGVGGHAPYRYTIVSGALPTGLSLNPTTGDITGTLTSATGASSFRVRISDVIGQTGESDLSINVDALADYYVSTSGSDSNAGTSLDAPWRTWAKARATATAGKTVMFRGGVYAETLNWIGGSSGTSSQRITFKAYPGESVTVRPPAGSERCLHMHGSSASATDAPSYIDFDGITFDGINGLVRDGVKITAWDPTVNPAQAPSHHIRFVDCRITNVQQGQGILGTWGSVGCEWIRGRIDHVAGPALGGANTQAVYWAADDFVIDGAEIDNNWGYGISNINSESGLSVTNHVVSDCDVHHCGGTVAELGGINLGEGTGTIKNCRVWECSGPGIKLGFGSGSNGIKILGNTIYQCLRGIDIASGNNNAVVRNNIAYLCSGGNYVNVPASTVQDHNAFGINPQFVDAAGGNFRLTASTPGTIVNAGVAHAELTIDADGVTRGDPPDIGAYEKAA